MLVAILVHAGPGAAQLPPPPPPQPPQSAPKSRPTTRVSQTQAGLVSSFGPDVYYEEMTFNFRAHAQISVAYYSSANPNLWFVASDDGHVWRSDDDGKTWTETRVIVAPNPFLGDAGQRMFYGATRRSRSPGSRFSGSSLLKMPLTATAGKVPLVPKPMQQGPLTSLSKLPPTQRANRLLNSVFMLNRFEDMWLLRGPRAALWSGIRSPNLMSWNRKQLIALRGQRISELWFPIPHPTNEKIVYLTTFYGLFVSHDGGHTFLRDFVGNTPAGYAVYDVAIDPSNPKRMFLATGEGMYVSSDGGRNYVRHPGKGVGEWMAFATMFHPKKPNYVFVCGDHGILRSKDGGRHFKQIYWSTYRRKGVCRRLIFDSFNPDVAYLGTFDGVFRTDNILEAGLESWRRMGGPTLVGMRTRALYSCTKHPGHLWVLAWVNIPRVTQTGSPASGIGFHGGFVFESLDWGKTWKPMFSGRNASNIIWALPGPRDPDLLVVMSAQSLLRMKRLGPGEKPPTTRAVMPGGPPITDVIQAALRYTGTDPALELGYRYRSRLKALVPRLDFSVSNNIWRQLFRLDDGLYPTLPYRKLPRRTGDKLGFKVMLNWNLSPLVFNLDTTMSGREHRIIAEIRERVILEARQAYARLKELRAYLANVPLDDLQRRMRYKLLIAEFKALVNFITGNYLERWERGQHETGRSTRYWDPWIPREAKRAE